MIADKNAKISYIDLIKEDLAIFHITPENISIPEFKPGQFLTLGVIVPSDGKINRSAYSIASPPHQKKYFELIIRWMRRPIPGKRTTQIFDKKEGDDVFWIPPAGTFTINEKFESGEPDHRRMVLIGGDIGLAPFISYSQYLKYINSKREIIVLHGVELMDELIYKKLLTELEDESLDKGKNNWNFTYRATISKPEEWANRTWNGNKGKVETFLTVPTGKDKSPLEDLVGEKITPENTSFYVCGWQDTIKSVLGVLIPKGFVTERNKRKDTTFNIKVESYG
ncbi:MAG TPA: FAD-binding oxidoreductase [Candidatus Nitrosocosmicus sp.]